MIGNREALHLLLHGELSEGDAIAERALRAEETRQADSLIMIPSESLAPRAVLAALGSVFTNLYAEGYPSRRTLVESEEALGDIEMESALYRRFADRRFYKGTEFADIAEALAEHRVAGLFATNKNPGHGAPVAPSEIFANVQALSGAAANNAVYEALLQHGDTILGMNLTHGGHLTHGSPYNRSGRYFDVVSYGVSPETGRLDYDEVERLALEHKPRLIVAGASAYPWTIDWARLRAIADQVPGRARLMADIAHPAGLVVAGLFPNPIGYADVVTFTTHKTMLGPRGAAILCTDEHLSKRIDRAVFPGEQGGPHLNNIFAMAVAFKLAEREEFRALQRQIVANAVALAKSLQARGLKLAYGGTDTHLLLIDLNAVKTRSGIPLKGDVLARILELCGVVANKNTIPGDLNAAHSSALRLGTVWVTQRGMDESQMDRLAGVIADVTQGIQTFAYAGASGPMWRGKIDLPVLRSAQQSVRELVGELKDMQRVSVVQPRLGVGMRAVEVRGPRARAFLQEACSADVMGLAAGASVHAYVGNADGDVVAEAVVLRPDAGDHYWLVCQDHEVGQLVEWLTALSDGYTIFDREEIQAKLQGPVVVVDRGPAALVAGVDEDLRLALAKAELLLQDIVVPEVQTLESAADRDPDAFALEKPYFVGQAQLGGGPGEEKPAFAFAPYEGELRKSCLYDEHLKLTAARNLVPFAGWSMPVWYTSIGEEHHAVRETAGLFDVTHMGVLEVSGEHAARFLDLVATNYVPSLKPGQAQYAYLLLPDGSVIDDILIYCLTSNHFMLVVNAANAEKDKAWFDAVNDRSVRIDEDYPAKSVDVRVQIRDLKDPASGADRRVDISLQGPRSLAILQKVMPDDAARRALGKLGRSEFLRTTIAGIDSIVSRTGYTGENHGYELYLHPDRAPEIWRLLLVEGAEFGLKPAGLGARDSTRTEAGLPLYGHELAGHYGVNPAEAGYGSFVKLHKTFFVGRHAFAQGEAGRKMQVVRFQMNGRGVRMAKTGDPVVNKRGEVIGHVTSAVAIDGQQTGLAYVDRRYTEEGTPIGIFPLPRERSRGTEPAKPDLKPGDRILIHEEATVVSRFPSRQMNG